MIMVTDSKVGKAGKFFALGFDMARFLASGSTRWWGQKRLNEVSSSHDDFVNNSPLSSPPHPPLRTPWALDRRGARAKARKPAPLLVLSPGLTKCVTHVLGRNCYLCA